MCACWRGGGYWHPKLMFTDKHEAWRTEPGAQSVHASVEPAPVMPALASGPTALTQVSLILCLVCLAVWV